ncbi:MAG: SPOR domain-containing protein [Candidatus Limimorpha sp.]
MINKVLAELLSENECVVVPELGAFISKDCPASLDYISHRLTPPSREIAFNSHLLADDGLVIGYLSERLNVSYKEAAAMVHDFVMMKLAVLDVEGSVRLDGVGELIRISHEDYSFVPEAGANFHPDAFGLAAFSAQPVFRSEIYHQLSEKISAEQQQKNTVLTVQEEKSDEDPFKVTRHNYKWFKAAAYSSVAALAMVLVGWGANKNGADLASWNPLFYSSPNEFVVRFLTNNDYTTTTASVATLNPKSPTLIIDNHDVERLMPLNPESLKPVDTNVYYIIGGSVNNDSDAERLLGKLRKQGFDNAVILPVNKKGNIRVAYDAVMGKEAAIRKMEIIKRDYNNAAWLLRKK